jgi:hypothetical protein
MTAIKKGTTQPASFSLAVLSALTLVASGARADDGSSRLSAQPMLYVGKFGPIERAPTGFGPPCAERRHSLPAVASRRPHSGWLIKGVFYARGENSRLISVPFVGTDKGPHVEVSVTVTDYVTIPPIVVSDSRSSWTVPRSRRRPPPILLKCPR